MINITFVLRSLGDVAVVTISFLDKSPNIARARFHYLHLAIPHVSRETENARHEKTAPN